MNAARVPASRPRVVWRDVNGILLLDKPVGLSSNAALQQARRLFRARKAGHTGSLDPLASGMLPVCFGQATKISGMLLDSDKTYEVTARLGLRTSTGDAEGEVIERAAVPQLDDALLAQVLAAHTGSIEQVPPMYSALKHEGQRLYQLARRGIEVEREARQVTIHELHLIDRDERHLGLEIRCSKGTYVRTLVEDIARALGTVGHVAALRRTRVGVFRDERTWTLEALEALGRDEGEPGLDRLLLDPDAAVSHWPAVRLGPAEEAYVLQGQAVFVAGPPGARVRMYGASGTFIGAGQMTPEGRRLAPVRIMIDLPGAANGAP